MHMKSSQAVEDYLKTIYVITRSGERASTQMVAELMGVTPASATGMIQKLANEEPPLLAYEKNHGARLTPDGEQIALEVIRHHRLLETYLQEKLGYTWDKVHEEADRLEHVISEELEERIAQSLGNPPYDPHGEPIPNRELDIPEQSNTKLAELRAGDRATITRISTDNPELLRYISSLGISIHSKVRVIEVSRFDANITLMIDEKDETCVLGPKITDRIFVTISS